jgi:heme-degrading monooxygenase HmoA
MITRIVQLPIDPQRKEGEAFIALFDKYKAQIAGAEGCLGVKMLRGDEHFFTYSHWESEAYLNAYRHSTVFKEVWPQTKALFSGKPKAWTCEELFDQQP